MSAYRWLAFVVGIGVVAALGAVLTEVVLPTIEIANQHSTTPESAQGISWYATAWEWMPLIVLILLMFMLFVGIIVRRGRTIT